MFDLFILTICLLISSPFSRILLAQTESTVEKPPLKVGVVGSPPFAQYNEKIFQGISVEFWQEIAANVNLKYRLIPQPGITVGIDRDVAGELDVLIGPISITSERFRKVTFTQPYFNAKIGLLVSGENVSVWRGIRPICRVAVMAAVGGFF